MNRRASLLLAAALATLAARAADTRVSPLPGAAPANLAPLVAGEIWVDANTSMSLPRGISSRGSFVAAAPIEKVRDILPTWNPQPYADLEVHEFHGFAADADPRFDSLRLPEKGAPFRKLFDLMRTREDLQLSRAELAQIPAAVSAASARDFWSGALQSRWRAFMGAGFRPVAGQFDVRAELKTLLAEEPKVAAHFSALLAETPLTLDAPGAPVRCYWQVKNVNGVAGFTMGAIYRKDAQFADFEFYVSGGYLVALTLYELRSVDAGGKPGTLVWQENFASSPLLTGGFGLKRKLATMAIESDVRRSIRAFLKELSR